MVHPSNNTSTHDLARYHRQIIFPGFGQSGQEHLLAAKVVVVGCGATGTALSNLLVRAGWGISASLTATISNSTTYSVKSF